MNELIDKAIAHITDEAMKLGDDLSIMIEEHLTNICITEAVANKLLNEEKTLNKLNKNIWDEARKRKNGNGAHIPDAEIFEMAESYYCITEEDKNSIAIHQNHKQVHKEPKKIVNIMDML